MIASVVHVTHLKPGSDALVGVYGQHTVQLMTAGMSMLPR
jgi:hypothetical protein